MTWWEIGIIVFSMVFILTMVGISLYYYYKKQAMINEFMARFIPCQNLLCCLPILFYFRGPSEPIKLVKRFNLAYSCLNTLWSNAQLAEGLTNIKILIMPYDVWDSATIKVAGRAYLDLGIVAVGPSMEALCHELIHIMEHRIDHNVDYGHDRWVGKKNTAVADYVLTIREDNGL